MRSGVLLGATLLTSLACGGGMSTEPAANGNRPPQFASSPELSGDHNREWRYTARVTDPDGDPVTVSAQRLPDWLEFDDETHLLSGTPGRDNIATHKVVLRATDGTDETLQGFDVSVGEGEILCNQDFGDPAQSLYVLPFQVGETFVVNQSYCSQFSHRNWFAYDFETQIGDTLIASRAGEVISVRESGVDNAQQNGDQNFIFIEHADGTVMWYVHIAENGALVEVGDVVAQGQPIAISGNTGATAGPHVHVVLSADRTDFDRQWSLPVNYRNTADPLDPNRGLALNRAYTALPFTPEDR